MTEGTAACFVEGFPGVGKTDMAAELSAYAESKNGWTSIYVEIPDQTTPSFIDSLLEVADLLASHGKTAMLEVITRPNPNPAYALERALRENILIVIDEAGRLLGDNSSTISQFFGVFSYLRSRLNLRGRILLLSDRVIERDRWSEVFPIKMLHTPSIVEAVALLTDRLTTSGHPDAVSCERKTDLVRILGQNPRAIETLVSALTFESLDEIIGHEPSMWEVSDRTMSPDFLEALERRLLERTLSHMQPLEVKRLSMLAVHRKSFDSAAFEALTSGSRKEWRELRHNLVSRFLVSLRNQWHSLNPLVREISLSRLRENKAEFRTAHSLAADFHMRHFRARSFALDHQKLTNSYAELQYHLFNSERTAELRDVALRLCDHFTSTWTINSPVPQNRTELDERIGVLSALLQHSGPKSLEYYLARCLKARGSTIDLEEAVTHISHVIDENARAADWLLRAQLYLELKKPDLAIQDCIDAVRLVGSKDSIGQIYILGTRILAEKGEVDDAEKFLRAGILVAQADKDLVTLYRMVPELLGPTDAAIELLKEGIKIIPTDKNLASLYEVAVELLQEMGKPDQAVELLKEGMARIPIDKGLVTLYRMVPKLLGPTDAAIELLKIGIKIIPVDKHVASLYTAAAVLLGQMGQTGPAVELLKEGMEIIPVDKDLVTLYRAVPELLGPTDAAVKLLKEGIKIIPVDKDVASLYTAAAQLLVQMDQIDAAIELLKEGLKIIPVEKGLITLYRMIPELLGPTELAVELLNQGLKAIPDNMDLLLLHKSTSERLTTTPLTPKNHNSQINASESIPDGSMEESVSSSFPLNGQSLMTGTPNPDSVLLMATEWQSVNGGLSTFNRQLCRTLTSMGFIVVCVVPSATAEETTDALQCKVILVAAKALPGSDPLSGLYRRLPLPQGFAPNVVIGHGRITGPAAKAQSNDHFPEARRIHFVHMAPGEIEWFKEGDSPATQAEHRESIEINLAADADLVAAVGPRLRREFSDLLRGSDVQKIVHEFVPGPEAAHKIEPPQLNHCLVLGRADDYKLKGLDIAARALGKVVAEKNFIGTTPELIVRGAKPGTSTELWSRLKSECGDIDLPVRVREYSSSEEKIETDLRRAALLLMPSRREGFGLVAIEALSKGIPVLVSNTSGFGEVLHSSSSEIYTRNSVVTTPDDIEVAANNWANAIAMQLLDRTASFSRAAELSKHLAQTLGWDAAVRSLMERLWKN